MDSFEQSTASHPESNYSRRPFRFHTRHLLGLMASVGIAFAALDLAIKHFGATDTTVEIINYHPTWEPGSVEFLVRLRNGFSTSAVAVPANGETIDYSKLVGSTFPFRYRAHRILWIPEENPTMLAYLLVKRKLDQMASRSPTPN